jgi:hypothetical protein
MHFRRTPLVLSLFAAASVCAAAQDAGPDPEPAQEPAEVVGPLAGFARMPGTWRLGLAGGWSQLDTWQWGPGKHSLRAVTVSSNGDGETTSGVCRLLYWHPGRQEIVMLSLFSEDRLAEGTVAIDGEAVTFDYDFYELRLPGLRRPLRLRWAFDGPDTYRATLYEAPDDAAPSFLAAWDYVRSQTSIEALPGDTAQASEAARRLEALRSLAGKTWEAQGDASGGAFAIRSTVEWIPLAHALYVRVISCTEGGESEPLFDAYVYHHPATDSLCALALSAAGGVHEGDLTVLEGGAVELDSRGYEGDVVVPRAVRFDLEKGGTLRARVWSLAGTERTLLLDVHHEEVEPKKD